MMRPPKTEFEGLADKWANIDLEFVHQKYDNLTPEEHQLWFAIEKMLRMAKRLARVVDPIVPYYEWVEEPMTYQQYQDSLYNRQQTLTSIKTTYILQHGWIQHQSKSWLFKPKEKINSNVLELLKQKHDIMGWYSLTSAVDICEYLDPTRKDDH